MLNNGNQPNANRRDRTGNENTPADQHSNADANRTSRVSATGELSRGRKRQRDSDGGPEHENGNESDMDLELLVESESDSEEEGAGPPVLAEDRPRRPATGEYNPPPLSDVCVVSRVLYSEDESSSGDEEIEENLLDHLDDEEEMDDLEEGGGDDANAHGARSGLDTRVRPGGFL